MSPSPTDTRLQIQQLQKFYLQINGTKFLYAQFSKNPLCRREFAQKRV